MKPSAVRVLSALALFSDDGLTTKRLGTVAGLATRGGSFHKTMATLRENLWVDGGRRGDPLRITAAGLAALGPNRQELPAPGPERLAFWRQRLNGSATRIFDALVDDHDAGGDGLTRAGIGDATNLATRGGSFSTALRQLRDHGLIHGKQRLELNPDLLR
jgi:hypothetical protein